jgi:DNA-binding cell septation regulator SpoVG
MIQIMYLRPVEDDAHVKALVGFYIPKWDLYLYKCKYVVGNKGPFISFPSQQYEDKQTGEKRYRPSHFMFGKEMSTKFQEAAVAAIEQYIAKEGKES